MNLLSELPSFFCNRKKNSKSHKKLCENKDFCNVVIPCEDTEILEFNQNQKCDKVPFIFYADLYYLIEKTDRCKNNDQNKRGEHISSAFSISAISSFKSIECKHNVYKGKRSLKELCEFVIDYAMKTINFKTKKLLFIINK